MIKKVKTASGIEIIFDKLEKMKVTQKKEFHMFWNI